MDSLEREASGHNYEMVQVKISGLEVTAVMIRGQSCVPKHGLY